MPDGTNLIIESLSSSKENYKGLGIKLSEIVIAKGAKELLKEAEIVALREIF